MSDQKRFAIVARLPKTFYIYANDAAEAMEKLVIEHTHISIDTCTEEPLEDMKSSTQDGRVTS